MRTDYIGEKDLEDGLRRIGAAMRGEVDAGATTSPGIEARYDRTSGVGGGRSRLMAAAACGAVLLSVGGAALWIAAGRDDPRPAAAPPATAEQIVPLPLATRPDLTIAVELSPAEICLSARVPGQGGFGEVCVPDGDAPPDAGRPPRMSIHIDDPAGLAQVLVIAAPGRTVEVTFDGLSGWHPIPTGSALVESVVVGRHDQAIAYAFEVPVAVMGNVDGGFDSRYG